MELLNKVVNRLKHLPSFTLLAASDCLSLLSLFHEVKLFEEPEPEPIFPYLHLLKLLNLSNSYDLTSFTYQLLSTDDLFVK